MNYLCHAREVLDDPYRLAGTALPDWLSALERRARLREGEVRSLLGLATGPERDVAEGVLLHIRDDAWFHRTGAFLEVSGALAREIRAAFPDDRRLRASFLAHVLLEMLLDAFLMREVPDAADRYFRALEAVDARALEAIAADMLPRPPTGLAALVERFRRAAFLRGYASDEGVVQRLSGLVMRVGLPSLPAGFGALLPEARRLVYLRGAELLTPPERENLSETR